MNYLASAEAMLESYRDTKRSIRNLEYQIQRGIAGPQKLRGTRYDKVGTSGNISKDAMRDIVDLVALKNEQKKAQDIILLVDSILADMRQDGERGRLYEEILRLRYINGIEWEVVADRIGYELRNTYYLRNRALLKFANNLYGSFAISLQLKIKKA